MRFCSFLLLSLLTVPALAADREALKRRATDPDSGALPQGWAVGPGLFYKSSLYRNEDTTFTAAPLVYYWGERCSIYVKKASCRVFGNDGYEVSGILDLRTDGYEAEDSPFLVGMSDRDWTLDAGVGLEFDTPAGDLELELVADVLGEYDGYEASFSWAVPVVLERAVMRFAAGYHWKSEDLVDHYYGVEGPESTPDRPFYAPDSASSWSLTYNCNWRISRNWLALARAEYQQFSSEIENSPIVEDSGDVRAVAGVAWHF